MSEARDSEDSPRKRISTALRWLLWRLTAALVVLVLVGIVLEIGAVLYETSWTGFGSHLDADGKLVGAKTLWDWLGLLIVPLFLLLGGVVINSSIQQGERQRADDRLREQALQTYLDRMSEMLLKNQFDDPGVSEKAKTVASARTLTILRGLDSGRKSALIRFLSEAELITGKDAPAIDLSTADLRETKLGWVYLEHANLMGARLERARLVGAYFEGANLRGAYLEGANLEMAHLTEANLIMAKLAGAYLMNADLSKANLKEAHLEGAHLEGASLAFAHLERANLTGASVTQQQLDRANCYRSTILPDGTHWQAADQIIARRIAIATPSPNGLQCRST